MISVKNRIALRAATSEDEEFVDDLVFTTMRRYVEATWPNDSAAQHHYYEINKFDPSNTRILRVDGKDVGQLSTAVREDCLFINELHVVPEYQRLGIGKQAIEQVFKEALEKNLPVKATVLKVNQPSLRLCLNMGFEVVAEKDCRFHIQHLLRR